MIRFEERVAVVTGAGVGLGRSYALLLASRGAKVVVNDMGGALNGTGQSSAPAQQVVEEIKAAGGEALANYDDVSSAEGAQNIIVDAIKNFGTIDILVNNAGILRDKSFVKMDLSDYEKVIRVHLLGTVFTAKAAFPIMREKGYGRIVNTASSAGLYGNFGQTNYSAAKMGIIGFMNALKEEGKKYNIRINTVAPIAGTRMGEGIYPDKYMKLLKADLVAPAVAYFCSEECTTTGEIVLAGGGHYAKVQVVESKGIWNDPTEEFTPEMFAEKWGEIANMKGAVTFGNATEELMTVLQHLSG